MNECPDASTLRRFLEAEVPGQDSEVAHHIDSCSTCQSVLESLQVDASERGHDLSRLLHLDVAVVQATQDAAVFERLARQPPRIHGVGGTDDGAPFPRIAGYEVLSELGRGGAAVVYRARQIRLDREVAIKLLHLGQCSREEQRERLRQEARALAMLRHPNIVQVYDSGEYDGRPWFSLELVEGTTLARWLGVAPKEPRLAAGLVGAIADAVQYAHGIGVLHRDLKPSNILIQGAESTGSPPSPASIKVSDFGLAKLFNNEETAAATLTESGDVFGTPSYMSPERVTRAPYANDCRVDVYSLGAILYALLTGRPPFSAETQIQTLLKVIHEDPEPVERLAPGTPVDLSSICMKCLEKEPWRRYSSAAELAEDLRRFLRKEPVTARPVGPVMRLLRRSRRRPIAAAAVCAALLALAAVPVIAVLWRTASDARDSLDKAAAAAAVAKRTIETQKTSAEKLRQASERLAVEQLMDDGLADCNAREMDRGLDRLIEALRRAEAEGWSDLSRTCRMNLSAWSSRSTVVSTSPHLGSSVLSVAFSPDGRKILSGQWRHAPDPKVPSRVCIWDAVTWRPLLKPLSIEGNVAAVAWSPDGSLIAAGSSRGLLAVWKAADGTVVYGPSQDFNSVDSLAFSPDGRTIAAAGAASSGAGELRIWSVGGMKPVHAPTPLSGRGAALAFTPDSRKIIAASVVRNRPGAASESSEVRQWDVESEDIAGPLVLSGSPIRTVACSPDGRLLVTGGDDGIAIVRDREKGERIVNVPHPFSVYSVAFAPDGRSVLACGGTGAGPAKEIDGGAMEWDPLSGVPVAQPIHHWSTVHAAAWRPNDNVAAMAFRDGYIRLFRIASHRPIVEQKLGFKPNDLAFLPSRSQFVVVGESKGGGGHAQMWDAATRRPLGKPVEFPSPVDRISTSSGGAFAVALRNGKAMLFEGEALRPIGKELEFGDSIESMEFSPDGRLILATLKNRRWSVRDWRTGRKVVESTSPSSARFDPAGEFVVSGDESGRVRRTSLDEVMDFESPRDPASKIYSLAIARDGITAAVGDGSRGVRLWDLPTRAPREAKLRGEREVVWQVQFNQSASRLYSVAGNPYRQNCVVTLWDASEGRLVRQLPHEVACRAVDYHPGKGLLVTGGQFSNVGLWDSETGRRIGPELPQLGSVVAVRFSSDGGTVAAIGDDGMLRLWPIPDMMEGTPDEIAARLQMERSSGVWKRIARK